MAPRRYYVDTSVFGGCFDAGWEAASTRFLDFVRAGRVVLLTSEIVTGELQGAPVFVREIVTSFPTNASRQSRLPMRSFGSGIATWTIAFSANVRSTTRRTSHWRLWHGPTRLFPGTSGTWSETIGSEDSIR